jgi:rod shape determining protein RodA
MAMLLRMVFIAERQRSTFSRVYAYSVAGILFFHIAINIGMTIGLAPVIGITLPLMSYGGSSLLTFTVLIFIMIKLDTDRQMVLR